MSGETKRKLLIVLALLLVAGCAGFLRLAYIGADPPHGLSPSRAPYTDEGLKYYQARNRALFGTWWVKVPHAVQGHLDSSPVPNVVGAGVFSVFGAGRLEARVISVVSGVATCLLLVLVGARRGRPAVGALAGLLAAFNFVLVSYDRLALFEAPAACLALAAVFFYLEGGRRAWVLAPLFLVLAYFTRVTTVAVAGSIALVAAAGAWRRSPAAPRRKAAWLGAVVLAGLVAAALLFLIFPDNQIAGQISERFQTGYYARYPLAPAAADTAARTFSDSVLARWTPVTVALGLLALAWLAAPRAEKGSPANTADTGERGGGRAGELPPEGDRRGRTVRGGDGGRVSGVPEGGEGRGNGTLQRGDGRGAAFSAGEGQGPAVSADESRGPELSAGGQSGATISGKGQERASGAAPEQAPRGADAERLLFGVWLGAAFLMVAFLDYRPTRYYTLLLVPICYLSADWLVALARGERSLPRRRGRLAGWAALRFLAGVEIAAVAVRFLVEYRHDPAGFLGLSAPATLRLRDFLETHFVGSIRGVPGESIGAGAAGMWGRVVNLSLLGAAVLALSATWLWFIRGRLPRLLLERGRLWAAVLLSAVILCGQGWLFRHHFLGAGRRYEVARAQRAIREVVGTRSDACIGGNWATTLCMGTPYFTFPLARGNGNAWETFKRFPVTHLILEMGSADEEVFMRREYPEEMERCRFLGAFRIDFYDVGVFEYVPPEGAERLPGPFEEREGR